jgi:hypothetical protein
MAIPFLKNAPSSLLQLDIDVKHEKLTNVSVMTYIELSEFKNANLSNTTV